MRKKVLKLTEFSQVEFGLNEISMKNPTIWSLKTICIPKPKFGWVMNSIYESEVM